MKARIDGTAIYALSVDSGLERNSIVEKLTKDSSGGELGVAKEKGRKRE